jgi:hypothetical protein
MPASIDVFVISRLGQGSSNAMGFPHSLHFHQTIQRVLGIGTRPLCLPKFGNGSSITLGFHTGYFLVKQVSKYQKTGMRLTGNDQVGQRDVELDDATCLLRVFHV